MVKTDTEKVFRVICKFSHNFYGISVFPAKLISERVGMSKYKTIKILHDLRNNGLVKRASQGCPAQFSHGEVEELICEDAPPINGWALTPKARKTIGYMDAEKEYLKGLAEWANGGNENG
ncbi:MAG: hypothetical protein NC253_03070 [Ruminococcus sp.]|nr:hypothetical protein [Ruminococcus sp.]MCM1380377.1 hypothetical protein [Muribaculaceae bacterium]MCM1478313.1 hypothetical protein [Muribaculaceae bacterium]